MLSGTKVQSEREIGVEIILEKTTKPFFKKHAGSQALAKERIGAILERVQATGLTKVKLALRQPVAGRPCFELRCNLAKLGSVRVAFTLDGQVARIWFISTSLQKATFTSEASRVLREVSK